MGDWHGTCFASSLPIFEGEDCAAILMVRNPYDTRRNTYPDDRYFPITAPLRGKYNGYGGIIPVRDSNYKALEAFIKDYPVLLFAKEQDPSTGIPIQDLSAALDGAIHCGVILNSKEFPTRKGNLVVEMGLLVPQSSRMRRKPAVYAVRHRHVAFLPYTGYPPWIQPGVFGGSHRNAAKPASPVHSRQWRWLAVRNRA